MIELVAIIDVNNREWIINRALIAGVKASAKYEDSILSPMRHITEIYIGSLASQPITLFGVPDVVMARIAGLPLWEPKEPAHQPPAPPDPQPSAPPGDRTPKRQGGRKGKSR